MLSFVFGSFIPPPAKTNMGLSMIFFLLAGLIRLGSFGAGALDHR